MSCCTLAAHGSVPFADFVPYIAAYARGAPDDLMAHSARLAAIDFCWRTKALVRDAYADLQAGVVDYRVELPDSYRLVSVKSLSTDGEALHSEGAGAGWNTMGPERFDTSGSFGYAFCAPDTIYLGCKPTCDVSNGLHLRAVVQPGQDSCDVDRWLYDRYAEVIANGAIYRLLLMARAPWADMRVAEQFRRMNSSGMSAAMVDEVTDQRSTGSMLKPVRFI
jgi:hypothetical protein